MQASFDDAGVAAPCTVTDSEVTCAPRISVVLGRDVYWREPSSAPPASGHPVVIVYQGSFFAPSSTWGVVPVGLAFGGYQQARLQALLLEHGFTVIAPAAAAGVAWQTNNGLPWGATTDKAFIDALIAGISRGDFGPIDDARRYATGISSGGYMTSRMALSYAGTFRALAIASGSWATCAGPLCVLPDMLPSDHPPTRFLHGRADMTVPLSTAEPYVQKLKDQGLEADLIIDDAVGHAWLPVAPEKIVEWFEAH
jgi:poly(3-hydroxybutyrate) depolymerase